jgi:RNA polymerase-binding transcription factor DksA
MSETETLLEKKKDLEERLERIKKDLRHELSADFAEQATELENRDVLLEIARVTEEELAAVNSKIHAANQ